MLSYCRNSTESIFWGGVQFPTGSKVCEERKLPNGCNSRTDGIVRMRKGFFKAVFLRSLYFAGSVFVLKKIESQRFYMEEKTQEKQPFFSAKKIAVMAIMTALAYCVQLIEFPIFPAASFLELDFSGVFILLVGFLYGPVEGIIVLVVKELLHIPIGSTGGVGELANIIAMTVFLLVPSIVYRFRKGLKVVIPCLVVATVLLGLVSLPVNRFINFPFFMHEAAGEYFSNLWYFVLAFNLIKGAALSIVTCLLYKPLSRILRKF